MKKAITTAALLALLTTPCAAYVLGAGDGEKGVPQEQRIIEELQKLERAQKQEQKQAQEQRQAQTQAQAQQQRQAQKQEQAQEQRQAQKQEQRQARRMQAQQRLRQQVQAQQQQQQQQQQVQAQQRQQQQVQAQQQQQQQQQQVQAQQQQQQVQAQQQQQQVQAQQQQQQVQAQQQQQQVQAQQQQQQQRQQQTPVQKPRKNRKYGPDWQVGDYWVVEATNRQTQGGAQRQAKPVRWRFEVVGMARIQGRDCYQAKITAVDVSAGAPVAHIWVDSETGALVRVATQTLVRGKWTKRVQTFQGENGKKSTGVFGTIPSLPLDMPLFTEDGSKALGGGEEIYSTVDDSEGSKALGDAAPRFSYKVKTTAQPLNEEGAKALRDGAKGLLDGAKGLDDAIEVKMDGGARKARQIWTPNSPWPVYSANDTSEARLVETNVGEE